ncbi:MAG: 5-formyltetrahydrofolate cyclo-ligase [Micrococcales bacterium]
MESQNPQNDKNQLRQKISAARPQLRSNPGLAESLSQNLIQLVTELGVFSVAAHLPFGAEPDIAGFIKHCQDQGIDLIMPRSNDDGSLSWFLWWGDTVPGIFGFNEPVGETANLTDAQLIVIPALAADRNGNRLGKGKGFYDRALAAVNEHQIPVAAVVYQEEVLDTLPTETHDHPVDFVVTPQEIIRIS